MNQLSIFDFLQTDQRKIDVLTEEEMVQLVGSSIGADFMYNAKFEEYMAKPKRDLVLSLSYSTYIATDREGQRFIGAGYEFKADHSGGSRPCDSLDEAIKWFKAVMERY